ncbi:iron (metal) dependent repressor, DtxR family [Granulicella pectinivorans]|jgi:DtxR family Mn-dependent transcriptional regulator|uniref:Transcriptional regulator MntR n=1 Tax=Granulicella pectinivorans TaxID=474950 RepID=A0A1I6MTJ5_9BACT|nr:metal-dependent transcriptional regulator [Granulicella pectinivorans]SFS18979.1 iron (metal) dependent repressor, DtxR family [Granulicella pectinivorans]
MSKSPSRDTTTESVDDYLKALFHLGSEGKKNVSGGAVAQRLSVAPASVTNMIQKLAAAKLPFVLYERHDGARLTPRGRRRALEIIRHHRLIETFLHRELGYPIDELHDEAERLEHFISESFEDRIAEKMGHPHVDPHGQCIPAKDGSMPESHGLKCFCIRS